jgi:hypothetical protein
MVGYCAWLEALAVDVNTFFVVKDLNWIDANKYVIV